MFAGRCFKKIDKLPNVRPIAFIAREKIGENIQNNEAWFEVSYICVDSLICWRGLDFSFCKHRQK